MDNNKIYQRCRETALHEAGSSIFKERQKRAAVRNCADLEFKGAPQLAAHKPVRAAKSPRQKISAVKTTLGKVPVEVHKTLHDSTATGRQTGTFFGREDEYGSILSGGIYTEHVDWKDCDLDAKVQSRLFRVLGRGLIIIDNIPKIPEHYEPEGYVKYYGFDSEDDSLGNPHFFQFATRDQVYISASFRLLTRYIMLTHFPNTKNHIVWGTNIEYDLGNLLKDWDVSKDTCDLKWTKGGLKKFELFYSPQSIPWAADDDPEGALKVWDTLNHWKMGVKDIGKVLTEHLGYDFGKLDKDFYGLKYSAMDAILSRSYACVQKCYYDKKEIALKFTPGATALAYYMNGHTPSGDLFCKHKLFDTHTEDELKWLIGSLRGGRTEVFSMKEYRGTIGYYDINSAYPFSMKYGVFPHPTAHQWVGSHNRIDKMINSGFEGVVECDIDASEVNDFVKYVPYLGTIQEKTGRYIFPLGKWKAKYTVFEIRKALKLGYKFKYLDAILYEPSKYQPFAEFVDFCYAIRDEGTRNKDKILRDIGKSLGNNLYGKFGQRLRFTELENPDDFKAADIEDCIRIGEGVLIEKDGGFAPHSNVIWSVYITAICRDLLYNHILGAVNKGNEIIYCDTDSIFICGGGKPESNQSRLGALKHEGDLSYFKAILPKTYIYESGDQMCYKAKGVPEAEKKAFLAHGMVEYKKPMKIREAMRRKNFNAKDKDKNLVTGITSVNAWVTVTKQLTGKYTKRVVEKDGSTTPIILG